MAVQIGSLSSSTCGFTELPLYVSGGALHPGLICHQDDFGRLSSIQALVQPDPDREPHRVDLSADPDDTAAALQKLGLKADPGQILGHRAAVFSLYAGQLVDPLNWSELRPELTPEVVADGSIPDSVAFMIGTMRQFSFPVDPVQMVRSIYLTGSGSPWHTQHEQFANKLRLLFLFARDPSLATRDFAADILHNGILKFFQRSGFTAGPELSDLLLRQADLLLRQAKLILAEK